MSYMEKLAHAAKQLKASLLTLHYAASDPRTPTVVWMLAVVAIGYALSPIDLIPDFIPVLGLLDDLVLLPCLIWLACSFTPPDAWADAVVRAAAEPLQLTSSRVAAMVVVAIWSALLVWMVRHHFQQ